MDSAQALQPLLREGIHVDHAAAGAFAVVEPATNLCCVVVSSAGLRRGLLS